MRIDEVRHFFKESIGEGKRFATQAEMARFLGLKVTTATKLYNFLDGADARAAAVIGWIESMGGAVVLPTADGAARSAEPASEEVVRLRAQLAAEKEKTAMLERLLATALSAGRGAVNGAADAPAAGEPAQRKAG